MLPVPTWIYGICLLILLNCKGSQPGNPDVEEKFVLDYKEIFTRMSKTCPGFDFTDFDKICSDRKHAYICFVFVGLFRCDCVTNTSEAMKKYKEAFESFTMSQCSSIASIIPSSMKYGEDYDVYKPQCVIACQPAIQQGVCRIYRNIYTVKTVNFANLCKSHSQIPSKITDTPTVKKLATTPKPSPTSSTTPKKPIASTLTSAPTSSTTKRKIITTKSTSTTTTTTSANIDLVLVTTPDVPQENSTNKTEPVATEKAKVTTPVAQGVKPIPKTDDNQSGKSALEPNPPLSHSSSYYVIVIAAIVIIGGIGLYIAYQYKNKIFKNVRQWLKEDDRPSSREYKRVNTSAEDVVPSLKKSAHSEKYIY